MSSFPQEQQLSPFDDLPAALHLSVLFRLRFVDRIRCCLVSKRWAALLGEPSVYADISFEGVEKGRAHKLTNDVLGNLVRRSAGQLRSLDVSGEACDRLALYTSGESLLAELAREGLTAQLQSLSSAPLESVRVSTAESARQLASALPALTHSSILVDCDWPEFPAIARALPLKGSCVAKLHSVEEDAEEEQQRDGSRFAAFAAAVVEGLCRSRIDALHFEQMSGDGSHAEHSYEPLFTSAAGDDGSDSSSSEAASRLAAALADPRIGPRALRTSDPPGRFYSCPWGRLPAFPQLCQALSPASPLRKLSFGGSGADGAAVAQLAAALGRCGIESVRMRDADLRGGDGCAGCSWVPAYPYPPTSAAWVCTRLALHTNPSDAAPLPGPPPPLPPAQRRRPLLRPRHHHLAQSPPPRRALPPGPPRLRSPSGLPAPKLLPRNASDRVHRPRRPGARYSPL